MRYSPVCSSSLKKQLSFPVKWVEQEMRLFEWKIPACLQIHGGETCFSSEHWFVQSLDLAGDLPLTRSKLIAAVLRRKL